MNLNALLGGAGAASENKIKTFKAGSIGLCILNAIEAMGSEGEPWRVRMQAELYRGKVITDGAFFGTINRLKLDDCVQMVRHSRQITVGDTSREESVAVYRLTERGHRSLHDSLHKLDEAQRRKLEGQLDGALQPSFLQQP